MHNLATKLIILALTLLLAACSSDSNDAIDSGGQADLALDVSSVTDQSSPDTNVSFDFSIQPDTALADTNVVDTNLTLDTNVADLGSDLGSQDISMLPDNSTDTGGVCIEDTVGSTPGLVTLGNNGLLEHGKVYNDVHLCSPFLIDYFKFKPPFAGDFVATIFHGKLPDSECFLVGVLTEPGNTDTLIDATSSDFLEQKSEFTYNLAVGTTYYLTVLKISPCSQGGDLQEADYGISISTK